MIPVSAPTYKSFGDDCLVLGATAEHQLDPAVFRAEYWSKKGELVELPGGRGAVQFVSKGQLHWVIRAYRRGGLFGKLVKHSYLWTGLYNTRPFLELHLLMYLQHLNLLAPRPIAALVSRRGLFYQAKLLTQRIVDSQTMANALAQGKLSSALWGRIGQTIGAFHRQGIYHADLNASNVLLDAEDRVYLIDFDKGEIRPPARPWQDRNLARLHRSLTKVTKENAKYRDVFLAEWPVLMENYETTRKDTQQ